MSYQYAQDSQRLRRVMDLVESNIRVTWRSYRKHRRSAVTHLVPYIKEEHRHEALRERDMLWALFEIRRAGRR